MKKCKKCRRTLDPSMFRSEKRVKSGLSSRCRDCFRDYERGRNRKSLKKSRAEKANCVYKTLDDSFFTEIDSEGKAYLLGWIASDGTVTKKGFHIKVHGKDDSVIRQLRDIICPELPVKRQFEKYSYAPNRGAEVSAIRVSSSQISRDVCKWLKIGPGKKSDIVSPPDLLSDLMPHFIRGYFEGDGSLNKTTGWSPSPICDIASNSENMLRFFLTFKGARRAGKNRVVWMGLNALDFLGYMYENANYSMPRKRDLYYDWCSWVPRLRGTRNDKLPGFKWSRSDTNAIAPFKSRPTDVGYDLSLIKLVKRDGDRFVYDTGIRIQPEFGWWFMLVPRSSITKSGFMMMNSPGIIDPAYRGNLQVVLYKVDKEAPDIEMPARMVQIIPFPAFHFELMKADNLDDTQRGGGGFGSTGT